MNAPLTSSLLVAALIVSIPSVDAVEPISRAELVKRGKQVTVLLETGSKEFATACCVDSSGYYVTCLSNVSSAALNHKFRVVANSSLPTSRAFEAVVVRRDQELDLALLKATTNPSSDQPVPSVTFGSVERLTELSDVFAFGFPFGRTLSTNESSDPSVSINAAQITSLRHDSKGLRHLQINGSINPGNVGGPLLDEYGELAGLVAVGGLGTDINLAIPISLVRRFVEVPSIEFSAPKVEGQEADQPQLFKAKVLQINSSQASPIKVELQLRDSTGTRTFPMQQIDGVYQVEAVPRIRNDFSELPVTVQFKSGSAAGTLALESLPKELSGQPERIESIQGGSLWTVRQRDGSSQQIQPHTNKVSIQIGSQTVVLDLSKPVTVKLAPVDTASGAWFECSVVVRNADDQILGRVQSKIGTEKRFTNILVMSRDRRGLITEYSAEGEKIAELAIPDLKQKATERARDLVADDLGRIAIFNGTFDPRLSIFDGEQWQHLAHEGWGITNNLSYGGIAYYQGAYYVTDARIGLERTSGVVRFDSNGSKLIAMTGWSSFEDLTMGLDAKLYGLRGATVVEMDSATGKSQRIFELETACRGIAVDQDGKIFGVTWGGELIRFSQQGKTELRLPLKIGSLTDIDISLSGQFVVASRFGTIMLIDHSLERARKLEGASGSFVSFGSIPSK